ncbi:hypothetical protein VP14_019 [Vibrio phage VPMCC14]|nr:hypothetical protein VP14_019 [Vibrio phage VPMCC14]
MALRGRNLIKRYDVPMVYRKFIKDVNNNDPWDNGESIILQFEKKIAKDCTIQSLSKNNTTPEVEGLDPTTVYVIYTDTYVPQPSNGENDIPSAFYVSNSWLSTDPDYPALSGGWYKVKSVQQKLNRVINHYKVVVVRDDNVNVDEYPDTSAFDAVVTTRDEFLSGTWGSVWLS